MEKLNISANTHILIHDGQNNVVTNENSEMLIQDKRSCKLSYIPLNKDTCAIFGMKLQEEDGEQQNSENRGETLSTNDDVEEEANDIEERVNGEENLTVKLWARERTFFLIDLIEEYGKKLDSEVKKNVWMIIAKKCSVKFGQKVTFKQAESKWKSLKRTYKGILIHNNTSGKHKRHWEFFDKIHNFMFKRPEIVPTATCSSSKGLQIKDIHQNESNIQSIDLTAGMGDRGPIVSPGASEEETSFSRKRKNRESDVAKRHREKMEKLDRFNDLFEKMVEKM